MRIISRAALVRIAIVVVAFVLVIEYTCRCGGKRGNVSETTMISPDRLRRHVEALAGQIGERNVWRTGTLARAAAYIEGEWLAQGYAINRQPYQTAGQEVVNLEVVRGERDDAAGVIVVGAHYDTVEFSPGANDNGSGVAALLELSRYFATHQPGCAVAFVAFANEEPPFFQTPQQGSFVYAEQCQKRGDDIRVMLALETMAYFSDEPDSQKYPPFFRWFYPTMGNFIGFVSNLKSRSVLHQAVAAFRARSDFPVECCSTWSGVPGVGWSDHASFWAHGYRAVMITDTAPYRYPYYHSELDTPDRLDYAGLARVTAGLAGVVETLCSAQ